MWHTELVDKVKPSRHADIDIKLVVIIWFKTVKIS